VAKIYLCVMLTHRLKWADPELLVKKLPPLLLILALCPSISAPCTETGTCVVNLHQGTDSG